MEFDMEKLNSLLAASANTNSETPQSAVSDLIGCINNFYDQSTCKLPQNAENAICAFYKNLLSETAETDVAQTASSLFAVLRFLQISQSEKLLSDLFEKLASPQNYGESLLILVYKGIIQYVDVLLNHPSSVPESVAHQIFDFVFSKRPLNESMDDISCEELKALCFCLKSISALLAKVSSSFDVFFKKKLIFFFKLATNSTNDENVFIAANYLHNVIGEQIRDEGHVLFFIDRLEDALNQITAIPYTIPLATKAFEQYEKIAKKSVDQTPSSLLAVLNKVANVLENEGDFSKSLSFSLRQEISLRSMAEKSMMMAFKSFGPEIVFEAVPLVAPSPDENETEGFEQLAESLLCARVWMLSLLKAHAGGQTVSYFSEKLLPQAEAALKASEVNAAGAGNMIRRNQLAAFGYAVFGCFQGFCNNPRDLGDFPRIVQFYREKMNNFQKEGKNSVVLEILKGFTKLTDSMLSQRETMVAGGWSDAETKKVSEDFLAELALTMAKSNDDKRILLAKLVGNFSVLSSDQFYERTLGGLIDKLRGFIQYATPTNEKECCGLMHVFSALVRRKMPTEEIAAKVSEFVVETINGKKLIQKRLFESLEGLILNQPDFFDKNADHFYAILSAKCSTPSVHRMRVRFFLAVLNKFERTFTETEKTKLLEFLMDVIKGIRLPGTKHRRICFKFLRTVGDQYKKKSACPILGDLSFFEFQKQLLSLYPTLSHPLQSGLIDTIRFFLETFPALLSTAQTHQILDAICLQLALPADPQITPNSPNNPKTQKNPQHRHISKPILLLLKVLAQRKTSEDPNPLAPVFPALMRLFAFAAQNSSSKGKNDCRGIAKAALQGFSQRFGKDAVREQLPDSLGHLLRNIARAPKRPRGFTSRRFRPKRRVLGGEYSGARDLHVRGNRFMWRLKDFGSAPKGGADSISKKRKKISEGLYELPSGKLVVAESGFSAAKAAAKEEKVKFAAPRKTPKKASFSVVKKEKFLPYKFIPLKHADLQKKGASDAFQALAGK